MNDDAPAPETPPQAAAPADSPEADVSSAVEAAITELVAEIDHLRDELERFNALAERYGTPSSVIYLDVNGMKDINDRFGHGAGDRVIVAVADALLANVRASDVVGRLGGDEFGVIVAHMDEGLAQQKAEALAGVIAGLQVPREGGTIPVSIAWGVFTFTGKADIAAALDAADKEMYAQKRGRE